MEHYKIFKLLNDPTVSKFVTRKSVDVNDLSRDQYSSSKNIRFKTSMLKYIYVIIAMHTLLCKEE